MTKKKKAAVVCYAPHDEQQPVLQQPPRDKKWTFSFRFWKQIQYFGLDSVEPKWFVSLLEKLKNLSESDIEKFLGDRQAKNNYRYHQIDWNQRNIPVKRDELDWLDKDYLKNQVDFPLMQFQLSRALGRVVGFWNENNTFNIVLLDPLHNLQPSKDFNYRVDPCNPLSCEYTSLLMDVERIQQSGKCDNDDCGYKAAIRSIPTKENYQNILMHYIDDATLQSIQRLVEDDKAESSTEILEYGILCLDEKFSSLTTQLAVFQDGANKTKKNDERKSEMKNMNSDFEKYVLRALHDAKVRQLKDKHKSGYRVKKDAVMEKLGVDVFFQPKVAHKDKKSIVFQIVLLPATEEQKTRINKIAKTAAERDIEFHLVAICKPASHSIEIDWLEDVVFQYFLDKKGNLIDGLSTYPRYKEVDIEILSLKIISAEEVIVEVEGTVTVSLQNSPDIKNNDDFVEHLEWPFDGKIVLDTNKRQITKDKITIMNDSWYGK